MKRFLVFSMVALISLVIVFFLGSFVISFELFGRASPSIKLSSEDNEELKEVGLVLEAIAPGGLAFYTMVLVEGVGVIKLYDKICNRIIFSPAKWDTARQEIIRFISNHGGYYMLAPKGRGGVIHGVFYDGIVFGVTWGNEIKRTKIFFDNRMPEDLKRIIDLAHSQAEKPDGCKFPTFDIERFRKALKKYEKQKKREERRERKDQKKRENKKKNNDE